MIITQELAEGQLADKELPEILASDLSSLQLRKLRIDNTDAIVYCDVSGDGVRPYVPQQLRKRIFHATHSLSHPSAIRKLIAKRFVWPLMNSKLKTCLSCQRNKIYRHIRNSPQHIPMPNTRFHQMHLDIVSPLPESRGFREPRNHEA